MASRGILSRLWICVFAFVLSISVIVGAVAVLRKRSRRRRIRIIFEYEDYVDESTAGHDDEKAGDVRQLHCEFSSGKAIEIYTSRSKAVHKRKPSKTAPRIDVTPVKPITPAKCTIFPVPSLLDTLDVPTLIDTKDTYLPRIHLGRDTSLSSSCLPVTPTRSRTPVKAETTATLVVPPKSNTSAPRSKRPIDTWLQRITKHVHARANKRYNVVACMKNTPSTIDVEGIVTDFEVTYYGALGDPVSTPSPLRRKKDGNRSVIFRVVMFKTGRVEVRGPSELEEHGISRPIWHWEGNGKLLRDGVLDFGAKPTDVRNSLALSQV